jgi:hypothetical protein
MAVEIPFAPAGIQAISFSELVEITASHMPG